MARSAASLAPAIAAVEAGAWAQAIARLEAVWRERPSARLGALVVAIAAKLPREELPGKTITERDAAWWAIAERRDPATLALLLAASWPASAKATKLRISELRQWSPSPRIVAALIDLARKSAAGGTAKDKLLRQIVQFAFHWKDPQIHAYLDTLPADSPAAVALAASRARSRLKEPALDPSIERLEALLAPRDDHRARLLADVHAAPGDDGPRSVLADVLVQAQDPRGELIALQLSRAAGGRSNLARERLLLRDAKRAWWDGLDADGAEEVELIRGFPGRVWAQPRELRAPAWATVETLVRRGSARFTGSPRLVGLRRLVNLPVDDLPRVQLPAPALDFLSVLGNDISARTALRPRTLGLRLTAGYDHREIRAQLRRLRDLPIGARVEALGFELGVHQLPEMLDYLAAAGLAELIATDLGDDRDRPPRWRLQFSRGRHHASWSGKTGMGAFAALPGIVARCPQITSIEVRSHTALPKAYTDPFRAGFAIPAVLLV